MQRGSLVGVVLVSVLSGADYEGIVPPCGKSLPTWAYHQDSCDRKTVNYSHDAIKSPLFGGISSINYNLKKNDTTEAVSMSAKYSHNLFSAQLQGSYVKAKSENTPSTGKTDISVQYKNKLWDSLALSATESVYIPLKRANDQSEPMKYTSLLKALYPVKSGYNVFAEGSYSVWDISSSDNTAYRNPYSYSTGIAYGDSGDTAINASYVLVQDADPTQGPDKKIKFAHKHKINKKIKTSLSVMKSLQSDQEDNKASFDLNYAF